LTKRACMLTLLLATCLPIAALAGCAQTSNAEARRAAVVATGTFSATATASRPADVAPTATATGLPSPTRAVATIAAVATTDAPAPTEARPTAEATLASEQSTAGSADTQGGAATGGTVDGLVIYQQQFCGICHQLDAAGTSGIFGPTHNAVATMARHRIADPAYSGEATTAEGYLRESILQPERYLVKGYASSSHRMPAYTMLAEWQVDALVQILLEQE